MDEDINNNDDQNNNNNNNNDNNNATLNNNETNLEEEESKLNEPLTLTLPIEESITNEITNTMKPLIDEQPHEQLITNQESNSTESKQENDAVKSSADDYSTIMKMLSDFKQSKLNKIDYNTNEETSEFSKQSEKEEKENQSDDEEEDNVESASNNTSYQELPSVCKSQTMADDTNNLNNSEKEDTLDQSLLRKPAYLDQLAKKNNLLNTSMQSVTSQCTIDSLAKRVQSLVGPIDYKTKVSSLDPTANKFDLSMNSSTNNLNNNTNKKDDLSNLSKHSSINYESIYKELDSIQDTLRMQHSFNKHLEKLTASRAEIKDLLMNDKLSESTFSSATKVSPLSSYTTITNSVSSLDSCNKFNNKDYLINSSSKLTSNYDTYLVNKTANKLYASGADLRTFKEDETKYFSKKIHDLKTDLEALSLINNSINKDLNTTNKFTVDLKSKLSSNYLTSSLSRMTSLNDMSKTVYSSSLTRPTSRSAFESDPDLLGTKSNKYQFLTKFGKSYSNTDTETVESSHSESDDAKSPFFSSNVYGTSANQTSRLFTKSESPTKPHLVGIYDRKENGLVKKVDKPNDKLDPDYLREMDKKLKKLIKKNLSKDLKLNNQKDNQKGDNQLAWEIDAKNIGNMNSKKDESVLSQTSTAASYGHVSPPPHPYLPLRDVPMHDMVKKLQREFELEQNVMQCTEMNKLWEEIKAKVESKTATETNQPDLNNLNSFLKNPLKTLLKNELEQHTEPQANNTTSNPTTTTSSAGTSKSSSQQTNKQDEAAKLKSLTEALSPLKFENLKNLNKEKVKEIIEFQKERHERRVKALEKLAKLERLQAEKLKKILQINDDITPHMYEMFIQQHNANIFPDVNETIGNETIVDLDEALKEENLSALVSNDKKFNTSSKKLKFNLSDSIANKEDEDDDEMTLHEDPPEKMRSKVEILNLKNTSIFQPPEGVCVVKETQQQQMKPDARVFFTIPCVDAATTNTTSKKFTSKSEPLINVQRLTSNNMNKYKSSCNSYTNLVNKESDSHKKEPKKLSLQEAFELYRHDLISRSRERQKEIQFRAEQRQRDLEYEAQQIESYNKRMRDQQTKKRLMINKNLCGAINKKGLMFEINVENFMHKRPMTTEDIKKQTKRIYEKLPEVKQKQLQLRAEELKRQNRLKSTLYRKTLQQRVLTRGPNFNLREAFVS